MVTAGRAGRHADAVVLGADTAVVVDGEILGKPRDDEDAARDAAAAVGPQPPGADRRQPAARAVRASGVSKPPLVTFARLTDDEIAWYVASGEGRDKAGGYAIQGLASRFIPRIDGSYSNVVGLPVAAVDELLRSLLASRL